MGANNEVSKFDYGNISVKSAEVRSGPSSKSKLIGYLPGPTGLILDVSSEKNGWINASIIWGYKGETWIRRKSVVLREDFKKYNGNWPIEYYLAFDVGGLSLIYYPENNKCPHSLPEKIIKDANTLASKYDIQVPITKENAYCREIWHVPGTNVYRFDRADPLSDISYVSTAWKNGNQIILTTDYGTNYTFKFTNGKIQNVDIECLNGHEVGCPPLQYTKPAKRMIDRMLKGVSPDKSAHKKLRKVPNQRKFESVKSFI